MEAIDTELEDKILSADTRHWLTYAFLIVLVLNYVYSCEFNFTNFIFGPRKEKLLELGALNSSSIDEGDFTRIMDSLFLHGDLLHLSLNGLALWVLGRLGESIYGPLRLLWIMIVSGIAGACLSWGFGAEQTVGLSGAIFGLLGAEVIYGWKNRARLQSGLGQALRLQLLFLGGLMVEVIALTILIIGLSFYFVPSNVSNISRSFAKF